MDQENTLEKVNNWMRNSIMLKLGTITFLILLLLIPTTMIQSVISEREMLSESTRKEVGDQWANAQTINGPLLVVPVLYEYEEKMDKHSVLRTYTKYLKILPETLTIKSQIDPKSLKKGIYEVVVYESKIELAGSFELAEVNVVEEDLKEIQWHNAWLAMGLTDLRGIRNGLNIQINGNTHEVKPGTGLPEMLPSGVSSSINASAWRTTPVAFNLILDLQGSENISFVPIGSTTNITLSSGWTSPSFTGSFLPKHRQITDSGFSAQWQVLELNRNFPQYWIGDGYEEIVAQSAFGTNLLLPMDDYQKSMRSAKYAIMTIGLTFLIFFMIEILNKRKIHPFQYILVGLSLSIFYVLLVSLSEHIRFNLAYLISMISVVGMITAYSQTIFKNKKQTLLLSTVMTGLYSFMFVTLQLADYALLLGSIGLLVIIGLTMYFTRNINWYGMKFSNQ